MNSQSGTLTRGHEVNLTMPDWTPSPTGRRFIACPASRGDAAIYCCREGAAASFKSGPQWAHILSPQICQIAIR